MKIADRVNFDWTYERNSTPCCLLKNNKSCQIGTERNATAFLVGAFLKKRARLLQSLVFFSFFLFKTDSKRRTLKVKINVQLLKVLNYWTAKGKHGERIHSLFQRYIQARTGLKFRTPPPPPFDFFFGAVRFFFDFF